MFKSYNFWVRLVSVLVLLLRIVGAEFGFDIDPSFIIDIATVVASILVVLGVIQAPVGVTSEGKNSLGGSFMKTMEQVKADILSAKEKLISKFGESETAEIAELLDLAVAEEGKLEEETQTEVVVEVTPINETEVLEGVETIEVAEMESVESVEADVAVEVETISEETSVEITDDKIKEVLRGRIMDLLNTQMDEIVDELTK